MSVRRLDIELQKPTSCCLGRPAAASAARAALARILNVPFAIADATALTEAATSGEGRRNHLLKLIRPRTKGRQKGRDRVIYIDEVDKIGRRPTTRRSRATCPVRASSRRC